MLFEVNQSFNSGSEAQQEYVVESILDEKKKHGQRIFLVKWKDYPFEESTWEPQRNFRNSRELIRDWELKKRQHAQTELPSKKCKTPIKKKSIDQITVNSVQKSSKQRITTVNKEKAIKKYDLRQKDSSKKYNLAAYERRLKHKKVVQKHSPKTNPQNQANNYLNAITLEDDDDFDNFQQKESSELYMKQIKSQQILKEKEFQDLLYEWKLAGNQTQSNGEQKQDEVPLLTFQQNQSNDFNNQSELEQDKSYLLSFAQSEVEQQEYMPISESDYYQLAFTDEITYKNEINIVQTCLQQISSPSKSAEDQFSCAYPKELIEYEMNQARQREYQHSLASINDDEQLQEPNVEFIDPKMIEMLSQFYENSISKCLKDQQVQTEPLILTLLTEEDLDQTLPSLGTENITQIAKSEIQKVIKIFKYNGLIVVQVELKNKQRINVTYKKMKELCCRVLLEYYEQYFMKSLN